MSAELTQAGARTRPPVGERIGAAGSGTGSGDGNGAAAGHAPTPIPQAVAAPAITATTPIVTGDVIRAPAPAAAEAPRQGTTGARRCSTCLLAGFASAVLGFASIFVVPMFKSGVAGKTLLLLSVALLVLGAILVVLGVVRDTARRL